MTRAHVDSLLAVVQGFDPDPDDARAGAARLRVSQAVRALPDPFSEVADPTHVTASAVVVSDAGVLLHRHKRLGIWVGPGGHVEPGESAPDAVLRETLEETGIAAVHPAVGPTLIDLDVHAGPKGHTHMDTRWLLLADPEPPRPPAGEGQEVHWLSFEDAARRVPADLRSALTRARRLTAG